VITQIFQESLIPTFVIDNNHIITHWNKACEKLTGKKAVEMIGTGNHWSVFSSKEKVILADLIVDGASKEEIARQYSSGVHTSFNMDGAYEGEGLFSALGENDRWLFFTAAPLTDDQGKTIGAIQTLQDITDRKNVREDVDKKQKGFDRQLEQRTAELTAINTELRREIKARKRAEYELRLSEKKFCMVADFTYDWEYWIDPQKVLAYTSPSAERVTGYRAREFNDNSDLLLNIIHPDDKTRFSEHVEKELLADGSSQIDFRIVTKRGETRWISHCCQPVFDPDGNNLGRRASNRDITNRKELEKAIQKERGELEVRVREGSVQLSSAYDSLLEEIAARKKGYEALLESEEELRKRNEFIETILDNLPIGLAVHTISDGVVHYMNSEFTKIYGWPDHALKSFDAFFDHVYPDPKYRKVIKKRVTKDIASRDPSKMIWKNVLPVTQSGESRVVIAANIPLFEQDLMIATAQDVTEKNKANQALQFTRFSIDRANDMIYWLDQKGNVVDVNKTICTKLGCLRDELLSMTVMDINPDLTLKQFHKNWENIKFHGTLRIETSHYCKSGDAIPVVTHSDYIEFDGKEYLCVFARDITERRDLERMIAIQDKMGSLGRVAAGIAHEIRNPLSTINVYLSTLKRLIATDDFDQGRLAKIEDTITEMDTASHKIETVVKRVMDFSKPNQQRMRLTNVNICVKDAVDLSVVTMRKSGITMDVQLDETLPECYMDCQLIEQVMLNLITNAREELIECQGEKHLEIKTALRQHHNGKTFIVITVADSGPGVSAQVRNKIFDPFYTTKQYGSGIGLSICHRIISDHDGFLHIATSRWGGAMFTAEFPVKIKVEN